MKFLVILGRLFNVRQDEWPRLALLYAMSLVALIGLTWGDAIIQAAFLQRVGVQYLPWVFITSAACSIAGVFIYTAFADRVSNTRLLIGLLAVSGAGILLGLAALTAGMVKLAYPLLYLVLNVPLLDLYNVHWATYVNGFYDIRAAKRIVPLLGTAECLSGIIAGLSMPLMNHLFSPAAIIGIMFLVLVVMAALAAAMPRILREKRTSQPEAIVTRNDPATPRTGMGSLFHSYGTSLKEGYRQILHSPFLLWMAISTLSMTILLALVNYGASAIFQAKLQTTVAISDYIGILGGVANLVVLPVQLFLLSRLISRVGLGNTSLIYPFGTLVAVGSLAIAPGIVTAGAAYLDRTALRNAFRLPTDNLLYNAVPQRVKARMRALIGGLLVPGGAIIGGLLLLAPWMHTSWFLPVSMVAMGLIFAFGAWKVRGHYGGALLELLEQEDYSTLALQPATTQVPAVLSNDPAHLVQLTQKLNESTSPERTIFMAQLIASVGGEAAVPVVGQVARGAKDSRLRASLVDVLVAADLRGSWARELYSDLTADPDGRVRLSAIGGLELINGSRDQHYLEIAARLLVDPEIEVRLRVLPALLAADDPGRRAAGITELRALLKSPDPHIRAQSLRVVGQIRDFGFLRELVRSLTDSMDEVRLAAALATEALARDDSLAGKRDLLLALALLMLHDPVERARLAAVIILDRLSAEGGPGATAARESLAAALADPRQEVHTQAVEALVRTGQRIIPLVHELLTSTDPHLRKMAAVVLARIAPRKYTSLVLEDILNTNLLAIYRNLACLQALAGCAGPAVAVLKRALGEQNKALLSELFYLLATARDPAAVESVARSLHNPQTEARAYAVEVLESLTAPQIAGLVAPLFEPDLPTGLLQSLARQTWDVTILTPISAIHQLLNNAGDAWQRTMAAAALADLSASVDPVIDKDISDLLQLALADPDAGVRAEVSASVRSRKFANLPSDDSKQAQQGGPISLIEKLILLMEVPFFQGMSIDQLKALASVCEQEHYPEGARIFEQGEVSGALYLVVNGQVGIEQEKRKGVFTPLTLFEAHSCLGETELFNNHLRTCSAFAIRDTLMLRLRREPVLELARQSPDLSLELINVLSVRLREANNSIAELTRAHSQELHKVYDQLI